MFVWAVFGSDWPAQWNDFAQVMYNVINSINPRVTSYSVGQVIGTDP